MTTGWSEELHPRVGKGNPAGGQFTSSGNNGSGGVTKWSAATKTDNWRIERRITEGNKIIARLLPAIKIVKADQAYVKNSILIGHRGEWHNWIASERGIDGVSTSEEIGESGVSHTYERGFVDPVEHIYYSAEDINLDAAELQQSHSERERAIREIRESGASFHDATSIPLESIGKKSAEILINPTPNEVQKLAREIRNEKDPADRKYPVHLRVIRTPNKSLYVWNASDTVHDVVTEHLGLSRESKYDVWYVEPKGLLYSVGAAEETARTDRDLAAQWLLDAKKAPKSKFHEESGNKITLDVSPVLGNKILPMQSIMLPVKNDWKSFDKEHLLEVLVNPTERMVSQIAAENQREGNAVVGFRSLRDVNANLYVWLARDAIHGEVQSALAKHDVVGDDSTRDVWSTKGGRLPKFALRIIERGQENAKKYTEQYGFKSPKLGSYSSKLFSDISDELTVDGPGDDGGFLEGSTSMQEITGTDTEIRNTCRDLALSLGGERQEVAIISQMGESTSPILVIAGDKHSVNCPIGIDPDKGKFELHHNHPDPLPLSDADLTSAFVQNLSAVHAYNTDGSEFSASEFNNDLSIGGFKALVRDAIMTTENVVEDMSAADKFFKLEKFDKIFLVTHSFLIGLNNAGLFRYKTKLSEPRQQLVDTYAKTVSKISSTVKARTLKHLAQ